MNLLIFNIMYMEASQGVGEYDYSKCDYSKKLWELRIYIQS